MLLKKIILLLLLYATWGNSQTLSLKEAIDTGMDHYGQLQAKEDYRDAAQIAIKQAKRDYIPNVTLTAQQDYGTVNGQNGPLYGFGGYGVASSGLPLAEQNWNAAFGALYLANVNWDFFSFGRTRQRIQIAKATAESSQRDYEQERFQHKIKIAATYLNLLASHRLLISQQKNLDRAEIVHKNAAIRVQNGLLPGVDSTLAAAEVSRAKIALNQIKQQLKIQNNELANYMGVPPQNFSIDTTFITKIPTHILDKETTVDTLNPVLALYKSRIAVYQNQLKYAKTAYFPTFSLFGIFQSRGSGFHADYATNQHSFTRNYGDGITPVRHNYLLGIGITWNLTSLVRTPMRVANQQLMIEGLQAEYTAISNELNTQLDAAEDRISYAMANYNEAPNQVAAAQQAYQQRMALYTNGLTNMVDVTQALYTLNRAETDSDVIYTNVWQALLMKAAATGDFNLFMNEF